MTAVDRSLVFLGSKKAGLRACRAIADMLPKGKLQAIVCPDDRADPRNAFDAFEALALEEGIAFHVVRSRTETMTLLKELRPHTAIVHGWYQILDVDALPETAFLGFHYSPLPRYRGNAPLVWQIIQGEEEIGVSFFELTAGMDEGRLVGQKVAQLGSDETIADALERADALAREMLCGFLPAWLEGSLVLTPQAQEEPSYCGLRVPDDGRIDWTWPAVRIHNFIRAQSRPYPGAFSVLSDGRRVTIWRSEAETRRFFGAPGAVAEIGNKQVVVTAGEGAVRLVEVEIEEDGSPVPAASILRSLKMRFT